jgi:uncharacterized protein YuzB (UPF0349 family)
LGTVPGWERAAGWTLDNRVYEGVGPTMDMFPEYVGEEQADYWIKFDVAFYFCESPPISPVVFRTLKDCMIREKFVAPLEGPVPTFEKWVDDITETMMAELAEDVHSMSVVEMGGLRKCGISKEENYAITVTDKGFTVAEKVMEEMKEKLVEEEKVETENIEEMEKVDTEKIKQKVPAYILGQIEALEERYKEAESTEEKMAITEEIDILKRIYYIS